MENREIIYSIVIIGFAVFLILRMLFYHFLARKIQKKTAEHWYMQVLNGSEFKVKGKYDQ